MEKARQYPALTVLKKILIANRGEIACRIIRTAKKMGIQTVAVYSEADEQALHVAMADEAIFLGPPPANQSYLLGDKIIEAALATGADSIHPGYGFLSENTNFSQKAEDAGITFIGPNAKAIESMGDKIISKKIAAKIGVSTIPGYKDEIKDEGRAMEIAKDIGFPVMIKAAAGGGGKGMRIAYNETELTEGFSAAGREAMSSFGDDRVFIEKFIEDPRHIEIQILCDKHGKGVYLAERECSIQRRNQKVVEEAPSSFLTEEIRAEMGRQSLLLAEAVGYDSAGTVEFVMAADHSFYFLEMNTRLQVEHPVTEYITGLDLVEEMIRVASGEKLRYQQSDIKVKGWAMESRLYSEDPENEFMPSIGRLSWFRPPASVQTDPNVRLDTGVGEGDAISMFYDPMIAKLVTYGKDRAEAGEKMIEALDGFRIEGVRHNLQFLSAIVNHPRFISGDINTSFIAKEWPDGFQGAALDAEGCKICYAIGLFVYHKYLQRANNITDGKPIPSIFSKTMLVAQVNDGFEVRHFETEHNWLSDKELRFQNNGDSFSVISDSWRSGHKFWHGSVDGRELTIRIQRTPAGIQLFYKGARVMVLLRTQSATAIAAQVPERKETTNDTELLCPMPGQIIALAVKEGDLVGKGQPLLIIEAMKMENTLRAENQVLIKKILCEPGQNVGFEDLLMEFEIERKN